MSDHSHHKDKPHSGASTGDSSHDEHHHHHIDLHHIGDSVRSLLPSFLRGKHGDKEDKHHSHADSTTGLPPPQVVAPQVPQQQAPPAQEKKVTMAATVVGGGGGSPAAPAKNVENLGGGKWIVKGENWSLPERYFLSSYLGGGSYGSVAKATDSKTGKLVAVKKIIDCFKGQTHALRVLREIAILRRISHPYIIKLVDVVDPPPMSSHRIKDLYVIFEFGGTDLQQLVKSTIVLNTVEIQCILKQLLYAVGYLHDAQVIHRDLKPANVLIDADTLEIRLADFGLARVLLPGTSTGRVKDDHDQENTAAAAAAAAVEEPVPLKRTYTEHVVTRWYRAPEVILSHGLYSTAIDVWSVGCIFAELLGLQNSPTKRRPLFPGRSCFPLSPTQRDDCYRDQRDQLNVIFSVIGTPDMEGIASLDATPDVVAYLESLPPVKPGDLSEIYPNASQSSFDLLRGLIHFNANRRISIRRALEHEYVATAEPHIHQPASVAAAMLRMDIEHRADKRNMIKSLEEILRNEIARMHSNEPDPDLPVEEEEEEPHSLFVRVHSGDLSVAC